MKAEVFAVVVWPMFCSIIGICVVVACSPASAPVAPDTASAACVSHRTVKQLECIDLNPDKASIDACRAKVAAELDCTIKDGGAQ